MLFILPSKTTCALITFILSQSFYDGKAKPFDTAQSSSSSKGHESFMVNSSLLRRSAMNILTQRSYFKNKADEVSKEDKEGLIDGAAPISSSSSSVVASTIRNILSSNSQQQSRNILLNTFNEGVENDDDASDDYLYTNKQKRPISSINPPSTLVHSFDIDIPRGGDTSKLKPLTGAAVHGPILSLLYKLSSWIAESSSRCWVTLMLSIFVEIAATTMTKQASDSGSPGRMTFAMSLYVMSLLGFAASLPKIDVSVAYAVWSALGTAFVSAAGILLFGEKCDRLKIASILMIVAGVIGLNMSEDGGHH